MTVLGVKGLKDGFEWTSLSGGSRADATILAQRSARAPSGTRAETLLWVRAELREVLAEVRPNRLVFRVAESGQSMSKSIIERAEVEGVLQTVVADLAIPMTRLYSASVKSHFGVRSAADLEAALSAIPAAASSKRGLLDATVAALAVLEA